MMRTRGRTSARERIVIARATLSSNSMLTPLTMLTMLTVLTPLTMLTMLTMSRHTRE